MICFLYLRSFVSKRPFIIFIILIGSTYKVAPVYPGALPLIYMQRYENFLIYANLPTTFLVKNTKLQDVGNQIVKAPTLTSKRLANMV